ncbi:hypothetical protein HK100_009417 [Physocladia obscura]|uniref:Fungal lipase-type domain-containing protein n=1 Tax=Physocladia obscura TaxID=109957 RepID=A0AAD5SPN2_9FUNG|nr:hypothetical protein HK100_009417 [Physocladia obscura]
MQDRAGAANHKIIFTGHSLGGARAHTCHLDTVDQKFFTKNNVNTFSVGFGAPAFGDAGVKKFLADRGLLNKFITVVNSKDPVPGILNLATTLNAIAEFVKDSPTIHMIRNVCRSAIHLFSKYDSILTIRNMKITVFNVAIESCGKAFSQNPEIFDDEFYRKFPKASPFIPIGPYIFLNGDIFNVEHNTKTVKMITNWKKDEFNLGSVAHHNLSSYHSALEFCPQVQKYFERQKILVHEYKLPMIDCINHENILIYKMGAREQAYRKIEELVQKQRKIFGSTLTVLTKEGQDNILNVVACYKYVRDAINIDPYKKFRNDVLTKEYQDQYVPWTGDCRKTNEILRDFVKDAYYFANEVILYFSAAADDFKTGRYQLSLLYADLETHGLYSTEIRDQLQKSQTSLKDTSRKLKSINLELLHEVGTYQKNIDKYKEQANSWGFAGSTAGVLAWTGACAALCLGGPAGLAAATGAVFVAAGAAGQKLSSDKAVNAETDFKQGNDLATHFVTVEECLTKLLDCWNCLGDSLDYILDSLIKQEEFDEAQFTNYSKLWAEMKLILQALAENMNQ